MQIRLAGSIVVALVGSFIGSTTCKAQRNDVIYEGARLIIGDASSPIESGAFVVRNGHITAIGQKGVDQSARRSHACRSDRARRSCPR